MLDNQLLKFQAFEKKTASIEVKQAELRFQLLCAMTLWLSRRQIRYMHTNRNTGLAVNRIPELSNTNGRTIIRLNVAMSNQRDRSQKEEIEDRKPSHS